MCDLTALRPSLSPTLAVLLSAVLWGTLWIPLREVRASGPGGAERVLAALLLPLIVLAPLVGLRAGSSWRSLLHEGHPGFWLALAVALYAEGLVRGSVARVILLFYLTPVWSTLLARAVLADPISARRFFAIGLGLAGLFVVVGPGTTGSRAGDWLGLAAGIAWAVAAVAARRRPSGRLVERTFVQFMLLAPLFWLLARLPGSQTSPAAAVGLGDPFWWLPALAGVWMLPVILLTLFGAARLEPGRYAMLLMFEVVVGLASSALLADEPFGVREGIGAALILAAVGVELRQSPRFSIASER